MALPFRRAKPTGRRPLVASAANLPIGDKKEALRTRYLRQGWQCADPATEALTRDGWKPYTALTVGDDILTLDVTSGASVWQPIEQLNVYDVTDTPMLHVDGRLHSSLTTMNHRWPALRRNKGTTGECAIGDCVKPVQSRGWCTTHYRRWKRHGDPLTTLNPWRDGLERPRRTRPALEPMTLTSAELRPHHLLRTAAPCADLPTDPKWSDALVEVIAWFWTEGNVKVRPSGRNYLTIGQSNTANPEKVARIRAAMVATFGPARTVRGDGGWREFIQGDMTLWGINGHCADMVLDIAPARVVDLAFIQSLTRAQLELFISTSVDGDGHRAPDGTMILTQSDPARLTALELAAILTGRTPHTYSKGTGATFTHVIHLREKATVAPFDAAGRNENGCTVSEVTYDGTVWCPTVTTGTWYARRDGTVYITGNSEAWAYYDAIGELRYAHTFQANAISRVRVFPAVVLDPKEPPVPLADVGSSEFPAQVRAAALDDLQRLAGDGYGPAGILHTQTLNHLVCGEYYVVGLPETPNSPEEWSIRSIDEIVINNDGDYFLRDRPPGFNGYDVPPRPLGPDVFVSRIWTQHPRYSAMATCAMRPLLESCEELLLASRMIRATLRSRIAGAGLLLVPDELELLGVNPTDDEPQANPFFEELAAAMITPLQSEGDAAEVVPVTVRGPAEVLKELRHLVLERPLDELSIKLRSELIGRIATGIDLPAEVLTGVTDLNHWCVDDRTEILTEAGWVTQDQLAVGAMVWTLNHVTGLSEWQPVEDIYRAAVTAEPMLSMEGRSHSSLTTFDHRWPVIRGGVREFVRSRDLCAGDMIPTPGSSGVDVAGMTVTRQEYTGTVWCPVTANTTWLARRDGKVFYTGNSAWQVDDNTFKHHLEPTTLEQVRGLTAGYARPQLAARNFDPDVVNRVIYWYDPTELVTHPDRSADAMRLHDDLVLSDEALLAACGWTGDDRPSPDEFLIRLLSKSRTFPPNVVEALFHKYAPGLVIPADSQEPGFGEDPSQVDDDDPSDDPPDGSQGGPPPADGPPTPTRPGATTAAAAPRRHLRLRDSERLADIDRSLRERLTAASDSAVRRQLEKAGARLRTKITRNVTLKATVASVPQTHVAATLGRDTLTAANIDPDSLLDGDYADLRGQWDAWTLRAQTQALTVATGMGGDPKDRGDGPPDDRFTAARAAGWAVLAAGLATVAARRLFDPDPDAPDAGEHDASLTVPLSLIRAAVAVAGGYGTGASAGLTDVWLPADPSERLTGISSGPIITGVLTAGDLTVDHWQWQHGGTARPFDPHVALDGAEFTGHEDPVLENTGDFPDTPYLYAGDHDGCSCNEMAVWSAGSTPTVPAARVALPVAAAAMSPTGDTTRGES